MKARLERVARKYDVANLTLAFVRFKLEYLMF